MLATKSPNIGSDKAVWVQCPNCSKMYQHTDYEGKLQGLPANCTRCGCPMDESSEGKQAADWMNQQAEATHDPAVANFGAQMRGQARGAPLAARDRMVRENINKSAGE